MEAFTIQLVTIYNAICFALSELDDDGETPNMTEAMSAIYNAKIVCGQIIGEQVLNQANGANTRRKIEKLATIAGLKNQPFPALKLINKIRLAPQPA